MNELSDRNESEATSRAKALRARLEKARDVPLLPPPGKPETPLQAVNRVMREAAQRKGKGTGKR